jgi:hypothetical protein
LEEGFMRRGLGIASGLSIAILFSLASAATAGFIALTGVDPVAYTDNPPAGPSIGDSFMISQGTFASYVPDTLLDPQINTADLGKYGYIMSGSVTSVTGLVANYSCDYVIFYNMDDNHTLDPGDLRVSSGKFTAQAIFTPDNTATFTGTLIQSQGPENSALPDLSEGGSPLVLSGSYIGSATNSAIGTMESTLRQNANVEIPEPNSILLAMLGCLALGCSAARIRV